MNAATETWDVFISYSTKDYAIIQKIVHDLQQRGISYWLDEEQINPGDLILDAIEQGLRASRAIMPCFSRNQLQSGWSRAEYSAILSKFLRRKTQQKIYPLILDDLTIDDIPPLLSGIKYEQYSNIESYNKLLETLTKHHHREEMIGPSLNQQSNNFNTQLPLKPKIWHVQTPSKSREPRRKGQKIHNLIPHFIHDQYQQRNYGGYFDALTMFVDMSGFTPMTQTLMKKGVEGAEKLADILNTVFKPMVKDIYQHGGFIAGFAGDALTAIFPLISHQITPATLLIHMLLCAEKIQAIFDTHGHQKTDAGKFDLWVKIGISRGDVHWGIVGRKDYAYFFRGKAIDGCSNSEHHAEKGEIIIDEMIAGLLRTEKLDVEISEVQQGYYHPHKIPKTINQQVTQFSSSRRKSIAYDVAVHFLPEAVIRFTERGEFRYVVPIFISFEGISTTDELNDWAFVLLENIKRFGGYFHHLDFGDKGGVAICGFGAPIAYEKMIDWALTFILTIKKSLKNLSTLNNLKFRTGITYGTAYAGIVGGTNRCVYTFYGEVVNLAARFMTSAEWGDIFVSEAVYDATRAIFNFESKGLHEYKGFSIPVPTYKLLGRKARPEGIGVQKSMVGRRTDLQRLQEIASPIFEGKFAGITYIHGEPGIGKSRLAYALQHVLSEQHAITWFRCRTDQILRNPFNPFINCLQRYFEQMPEEATEAENKTQFENKYYELLEQLQQTTSEIANECMKELKRTKTVIGAQLGIFWPDSLWEQLDAERKHQNTIAAIKNFFLAHSLLAPIVIELEDGHWFDTDSISLLRELTRNIANYPIFIFSTVRYKEDGTKYSFQLDNTEKHEIELKHLSPEENKEYTEVELNGHISDELHELLLEKANGNPLFMKQLIRFFLINKIINLQESTWQLSNRNFGVPADTQAIVICYIDSLSKEAGEVVKAAAVIGREFDMTLLSSTFNATIPDLTPRVQNIVNAKIWEEVQEHHYRFEHTVLRDTAYKMQSETRRLELHQQTAETIEIVYSPHIERHYAELAYHYEHANTEKSEIREKAIEYLQKAGDAAKLQFQNQQAIDFYTRLLIQLRHVPRFTELHIDTLLKKAEILDLIGKWKECQQVCEEALRLSEQIDDKRRMGQVNRYLGVIFRREGQHDKAMTYLKQAIDWFETVKDKKGIGLGFSSMGMVYWQGSNDDAAMTCYEKALKIAEELEDKLEIAKNADNIGIIYYEMKGNFKEAMIRFEKSLQIFEELRNKLEKSKVLNNIGECHRTQGHYEAAMERYKKTLEIAEEFGDKFQVATTLANIGHVYRATGEYNMAIANYDRAISMLKELGDKFVLCECLIDKAEVLFLLQRYDDAQALNSEGLSIAQESSRKDYTFLGKVLSSKVVFALREGNAPHYLEDMLQQTQNTIEIATLHYELWKMTHRENHRQNALKLYRTLSADTPNIDYKIRIEEMM